MRCLIFLILFGFSSYSDAQTLFSFGKNSVSTGEFLRAYNKNRTGGGTRADMKEYLQLYINYRLKVQDAIDHQLDTLPSIRADLQNFRHQLESGYQYDKDKLDRLTSEAIERSRKDIRVRSVIITLSKDMDSSEFKDLAEKVRTGLLSKKDKEEAESQVKNDVTFHDRDMGFVTVFTLPYDIENIIYSLKTGEASRPVLINGRYWIFENKGERPAAGMVKVAQILLSYPPADSAGKIHSRKLADSLYHVLMQGSDFAALAKEFSNDRNTYLNGGIMPEFGVGKFSSDFEEYAFALKNPGAISVPFETSSGFHILKLLKTSPVALQDPDGWKAEIMRKVLQDGRIRLAKEKMEEKAAKRTGVKALGISVNDLYNITDSFLLTGKILHSGSVDGTTPIFGFNDGTKVVAESWLHYARNNANRLSGENKHLLYERLWIEFRNNVIMNNYRQRLPEFEEDFTTQLNDFNEGNMLFEMMQRNVWNKAEKDSIGLWNCYNHHPGKYKWRKSADAIIFYCSNTDAASSVAGQLRSGKSWREIQAENAEMVQADSGRFELTHFSVPDSAVREGINTPIVNEFDNSASFSRILKIYPADEPKSFSDARGLVVEDYQNELEAKWINELKMKYPVKINQQILDSVFPDN